MVYIDFINDKEDLIKKEEKKYYDLVKKLLIFYRERTNFISISKTEFGDLIQIQNFNSITMKKLKEVLEINCIKTVCLSDKFEENEKVYKILKEKNIRLIDGNELKKYLLSELIEYVCRNKSENLYQQEVAFLVNKNTYLVNCRIKEISKKVKNVNIITKNPEQFKNLEKDLYEKDGIILNLTNNYKKSLVNSDIIINIDYNSEEINKYIIPKYCCFINLENDYIAISKKSFEGININDLKYLVNKRKLDDGLKNFDKEIFYESIVMRNSNPENILNKIKKDNVKIIEVYGKNGIIAKREFEKLKRKIIS